MTDDLKITVIPEEADGAAMRRLQKGHYVRCDGRDDAGPINDALERAGRTKTFSGFGEGHWRQNFGKNAAS
jgi:hypothetical protein